LIDKKTVFVLGAGASCPYGYPSGARLRERVCLSQGFILSYNTSRIAAQIRETRLQDINKFKDAFNKSRIKSIDLFMAHNPKLASIGKYIIAFEILRAEQKSLFGEEAKLEQETLEYMNRSPLDLLSRSLFQGEDWCYLLYNRLIEGLVGKDALPDFSNVNIAFVTFNYDRSLEQYLYEALRYSFIEVSEERIVQALNQLKILHVYGKIASLKWQNQIDYVDYKPKVSESLLQRAANNIRTIYEEKQNPELIQAQNLLKQAEEIFFLGFGYADENMEVLGLPDLIPPRCEVYGTAFNMIPEEVKRVFSKLHSRQTRDKRVHLAPAATRIDNLDCLMLLRKYLN